MPEDIRSAQVLGDQICQECGESGPANAIFCMGCGNRLGSGNEGLPSQGGESDLEDLTGQQILEYTLDRKIGEGGMGSVYIGHHHALGQRVAVKVLHPELALNPEIVARFIQEARIQSRLNHPNVVSVFTASTTGPHIAMVMDYVEGISLAEVLERRGSLPLNEALSLFEQVLDVVGYAHGKGVVHRDLKPSNIMITADGRALVMDFGIAKVVSSIRHTRTGTAMGSALYMSPEQILGKRDVDHRTDIYALGISLFEIVTGQVPFGADDDDTTNSDFLVRQAHIQRGIPDPSALREDLPQAITDAILRALAKAPDERFQSCEAFRDALPHADSLSMAPSPPLAASEGITSTEEQPSDPNVPSHLPTLGVPDLRIAPIWRRAVALLLDSILVGLGAAIATFIFAIVSGINADMGVAVFITSYILAFTVYSAEYVRRSGATPGKRLLGLKVTSENGAPVSGFRSWMRAILQNVGGVLLAGTPSLVDHLWSLFNSRRRCIHDFAADSIVTYIPAEEPSPTQGALR